MSYQIEERFIELKQYALADSRIIIAHDSENVFNTGKSVLENEIFFMTKQTLKGGAFVSHWVSGGGKIIQISKTGFVQYSAGANANSLTYAQLEIARTLHPVLFKKDSLVSVWLLKRLTKEAQIPTTLNIGNTSKNKGNKTHHWISSELGETNHRDPNDWLARFGVNLSPFASDLADYPKENSLQIVSLQETHLVLFGETLWSIAKKHQTTVTWLKKLNHLPSDHIKSGTVLLLTSAQIEIPFLNQSIKKRTEIIKMIQKNCGTIIDGLFGPITKKALLCLFQEAIHAPVDGLWGIKTATLVRNIQVKTKGKDVYAVQAMLFGFGYEVVGIPDCIVGDLTRLAILLFQKEQHLVCEGIADKKTLSLLFQ